MDKGTFYGNPGIGRSGGSYWTQRWITASNFYELWKVTGAGTMTGLKRGDPMTIIGSGLNAIYAVPDTDAYKTRDTDYVFHKSDGSISTACDGNRLIAYDFPKIIVKYLDVAPYTIEYIGILDTGQSVTNQMRDDFHLSIWWDNVSSNYGKTKGNRSAEQSIWWGDYDAASIALFVRMGALSEVPIPARRTVIDTAILADKAASMWTGKYDALWALAAHGTASAKLNIVANAFNITPVSTPTHTIDRGFTGDGSSKALNANINLSTQTARFLLNAGSYGVYIRNNAQSNTHIGCGDATHALALNTRYSDNNAYYTINAWTYDAKASTDSRGMWIVVRSANNVVKIYKNGVEFDSKTTASIALPNAILHLLCYNNNGTLANWDAHEIALAFIGGVMSPTEVTAFQTIWVDGYLASIGAKI
jgi:hypothetical protein